MKSILSDDLREQFYIRVYFNTSQGYYVAGINRAFQDFCRTLKIKDENRTKLKQKAITFLISKLSKLNENRLKSQDEFDIYHKETCYELIQQWNELTIGQAQKWINMTLKYWLLLGEKRIKGIELNAIWFHIPIDQIVQHEMFREKEPTPWSKINNYDDYYKYQIEIRNKKTGNPALIDEFKLFNKTQTS